MFYLNRTPWLLRKCYGGGVWQGADPDCIYLTFDDGPHPSITSFVMEQLNLHGAKATFFCIGKNVMSNYSVYEQILQEGHQVGNHTQHHLNGWKTNDETYLNDIAEAQKYIDSNLFRPPYGKITRFQLQQLAAPRFQMKCIMWSLLSGDFDVSLSPKKCLEQLIVHVKGGEIIVFHDSDKAFERLKYALPFFLKHCKDKGFRFEILPSV